MEGEVAIGEEEDNKCGKNVDGGVDDTVNPAVFFGGIVERVGGIYDTHENKEDANRRKNNIRVVEVTSEECHAAEDNGERATEDKGKPMPINIFTINMCHDFSLIKMLVLIITHFCTFMSYIA